jgi:GT2 family glycosyltransferase
MIYTHIPYAPKEKKLDLGWSYNNFMNLVNDDDWVLFLDHDAMFTTKNWFTQIEDIIEKNPEYSVFTCMTNRIGIRTQKLKGVDSENHNITYHRNIGKDLGEKYYSDVVEYVNEYLSGVVILIKKDTWNKVGGFKPGFLGVDNRLHKDCINNGIKVGLMTGVYVYHWYRGDNDRTHINESKIIHNNPF